jgi:hypothetical protein
MRKHVFFFLTLITSCLVAIEASSAGTIPAGTALVVETLNSIYTRDMVGKEFTARLSQDIVVKGSVVAPAGTKFMGKVESSTKIGSLPLTVNLTGANVGGKLIPLKTTGAYQPQSMARGRRAKVSTRDFVLPPGSKMQFHLAQPLTL